MERVDVTREHPARKVAEITLGFWLAKVVATTLGEVAGDAIAQTLNLGYVAGLAITLGLLAAFLVAQVRADRYHPFLFWATIVGTTTAGTEIADLATHTLNLGYNVTSAILFGGMLLTLGIWYLRRGTCDVSAVINRESELLLWGAVLFSNSLGTAFGDGLVYVFGLTYTTGSLVCMAVIGAVLLLHYVARVNAAFIFSGRHSFSPGRSAPTSETCSRRKLPRADLASTRLRLPWSAFCCSQELSCSSNVGSTLSMDVAVPSPEQPSGYDFGLTPFLDWEG